MSARLYTQNLDVQIAQKHVVRGLDLQIKSGEVWVILGQNGIGKTTLLHTLAGLRKADAGTIGLDHVPLAQWNGRQRAQRLGLLPQRSEDVFSQSVLDVSLAGRYPYLPLWQSIGSADLQHAQAALKALDITDLSERDVRHLSGGERQRVAIASLLTQDPDVALLDEPIAHLDLHHQMQVLSLLRNRTQQQDRCVVMVLHDANLAWQFSSHVLLLYGQGCWEAGPAHQLLTAERLSRLLAHPIEQLETRLGPIFQARTTT
jgi:iron complex transport system ATP-binding protein